MQSLAMIENLIHSGQYREALGLPAEVRETYELLAQGEYNVNYCFTHPESGRKLVLRVNMGSQMHLDRQIEYEAHALKLLADTGRTPRVHYVDGSGRSVDHGILVMDYLPGDHPDYGSEEDMAGVMACLADIHALPIAPGEILFGEPEEVPRDTTLLIAPADAGKAILDECEMMAQTYFDSPLADSSVKLRLRALLDRGHAVTSAGSGCDEGAQEAPGLYRCCVNTELNSTNFLVERDGDGAPFVRLVDWEKPLYADPAQDLAHLLAPTTTFWKTDTVYTKEEIDKWIGAYLKAVGNRFETAGLPERTRRLINITCLRGLTWCAMAWVQYRAADKDLMNESTARKLDAYLSDEFLSLIEEIYA